MAQQINRNPSRIHGTEASKIPGEFLTPKLYQQPSVVTAQEDQTINLAMILEETNQALPQSPRMQHHSNYTYIKPFRTILSQATIIKKSVPAY